MPSGPSWDLKVLRQVFWSFVKSFRFFIGSFWFFIGFAGSLRVLTVLLWFASALHWLCGALTGPPWGPVMGPLWRPFGSSLVLSGSSRLRGVLMGLSWGLVMGPFMGPWWGPCTPSQSTYRSASVDAPFKHCASMFTKHLQIF